MNEERVGSVGLNLAIFLAFVLVTLVLVYRAGRSHRTASDYYAAGRGFTGAAERRRDRGRLPLGRLVPRHRGRHRA